MPDARPICIRRALLAEAGLLSELAFRSKAFWGYSDEFMEACRTELTITAAYLAHHRAFVVEREGTLVGFYTLERQSDSAVELGFLFVEPAFIGQGYGRRLMEHAKEQAWAEGYATLLIQGDPHAASFYEAAGARVIGSMPSASIAGRSLPLFEVTLYAAEGTVAEGS